MVGIDYSLLVSVDDPLQVGEGKGKGKGKTLESSGDDFIKLIQQEGKNIVGDSAKSLEFLKWAASSEKNANTDGYLVEHDNIQRQGDQANTPIRLRDSNITLPFALKSQSHGKEFPVKANNELNLKSALKQVLGRENLKPKLSSVRPHLSSIGKPEVHNTHTPSGIEHREATSEVAFINNKTNRAILPSSAETIGEITANGNKKLDLNKVLEQALGRKYFKSEESRLHSANINKSDTTNELRTLGRVEYDNLTGDGTFRNIKPEKAIESYSHYRGKEAIASLKNLKSIFNKKSSDKLPEVVRTASEDSELNRIMPRMELEQLNKVNRNTINKYSSLSGDKQGSIFIHPMLLGSVPNEGNNNLSYSENISSALRMEEVDGKVSDLETGFASFTNKSDTNGSISVIKLDNSSQLGPSGIIDKLSDYIMQSGIKNSRSLEVLVEHGELGHFKINANKVGVGNQVDISIETGTGNATDFFNNHEVELIKSLMKSGVKIGKVNIVPVSEGFVSTLASGNTSDISHNDGESREDGNYGKDNRKDEGRGSRDERNRRMWQELNEGMDGGTHYS